MRALLLAGLLAGAVGCEKSPVVPQTRAAINRTGGTTFEIVPAAGQFPNCLAFTVTKNGLTRQLTMSHSNQSFQCAAGRPVAGHSYKVPLSEGPVKVYVFFTSQAVNAALVAQEILEARDRQGISAMDLRLPGNVVLEVIDFVPEEDTEPELGHLLHRDGGVEPAVDAGSAEVAVDAGQP